MDWRDDVGFATPKNKIACMTCAKRHKKNFSFGGKLNHCDAYPNMKPTQILFDEAQCKYYVNEKGEDDMG